MKKHTLQFVLWAVLVTFIFLSIAPAIQLLPTMVGKEFEDTDQFKNEKDTFYRHLTGTILNPVDWDQVEEQMPVSVAEIDEHRYHYGSLSEQVQNIMDQYAERLDEAEANGNEKVAESLMKERDGKIQDIEQNFDDADHVREKVLKEKLSELKRRFNDHQGIPMSTDDLFSFHLTDVKTGEVFERGTVGENPYYQEVFDQDEGYLKASGSNLWREIGYDYDEDIVYLDSFAVEIKEIAGKDKQFEGIIEISARAFENSELQYEQQAFYWKKYRNYTFWILAILALVVVLTKLKFKRSWLQDLPMIEKYRALTIDVQIILLMMASFIGYGMKNSVESILYYSWWYSDYIKIPVAFIGFSLLMCIIIVQVIILIERWKRAGQFQEDVKNSFIGKFIRACRDAFLYRSIGVQTFILLIGAFLAGTGLAVFNGFIFGYGGAVVLFLLYMFFALFIGIPAMYIYVRRMAYLNRVFKAAEQMAAGTLQKDIKVKGNSPIAKHAEHLNALREGVRLSMTEQAKSERLKTELITNVSHDLRTPLTSIITYTDLLKTTDLPEDERLKYVMIVDQKAGRLKTLIEDLFEVSKMASGNMTLTKQKVDLTQLLQQSLAEHEDRITESSLDFRVELPETPLYAFVDGQKWWRVLDNLILNTLKYSLGHTRVYIQLTEREGRAVFTIKNISEYALNGNSEELFERFKRGDASRHTEGSGLGLAIAQSIVDMHQGEMKIEMDGDLFKVTVSIATQS